MDNSKQAQNPARARADTRITTCVFDAYGTLFDTNAAARAVADDPAFPRLRGCWAQVAADWRLKQLQYTWLRAIANAHADFWHITQQGLDWALEASGLHEDAELRARLLQSYWRLSAFEEVFSVLTRLRQQGMAVAILSNGTPAMVQAAVDSAGIGTLLDALLSVESVGIFKPAAAVYNLVEQHFGCEKTEVLFVSSNGWDAAAAAGYGFTSVWVNRAEHPMERLPWAPQHVVSDLNAIPDLMR
ncbi:MAG: haloacid dehalogenase type II [Rhodobacteraceae bacterium]|nr:haloacid dehalogenase type II [Paracoccaceae bacterium]